MSSKAVHAHALVDLAGFEPTCNHLRFQLIMSQSLYRSKMCVRKIKNSSLKSTIQTIWTKNNIQNLTHIKLRPTQHYSLEARFHVPPIPTSDVFVPTIALSAYAIILLFLLYITTHTIGLQYNDCGYTHIYVRTRADFLYKGLTSAMTCVHPLLIDSIDLYFIMRAGRP